MHAKNATGSVSRQVGKGVAFVFLSNIARVLLNILTFAVLARSVTQEQFGFFSLSLVCANLLASISCIGFENSLPGFIAQKKETGQHDQVVGAIRSSGRITLCLSLASMALLYGVADWIATVIDKPALAMPLKIMAPAIPLIACIMLYTSYLRSFENNRGKIIDMLVFPLVRLLLIGGILYGQLSFHALVGANTISFFLVFILLFFFTRSFLKDLFNQHKKGKPVGRELFFYSLPVLGVSLGRQLMMWTDTMMLGVFSSALDVGIYSAGIRIARLISIIGVSANFVVLPIMARLYRQGKKQQLQDLYHGMHGTVLLVILPIFWTLLFAHDQVMLLFFGGPYASSNFFLAILGAGWVVSVFSGINASVLLSVGKNKVQLYCFLAAAAVNILANYILIPLYVKNGAATASCLGFMLYAGLSVIMVKRHAGLELFKEKKYLLFLGGALLTTGLFYFLAQHGVFITQSYLGLLLHMFLYALASLLLATVSGFLHKDQLQFFTPLLSRFRH